MSFANIGPRLLKSPSGKVIKDGSVLLPANDPLPPFPKHTLIVAEGRPAPVDKGPHFIQAIVGLRG